VKYLKNLFYIDSMDKFGAGTGWVGADIKKKEGRKTI